MTEERMLRSERCDTAEHRKCDGTYGGGQWVCLCPCHDDD